MNVAFQLKVPVDVAVDLNERLRALQIAHEKDVAKLDKRIKLVDGDPKKLTAERDALSQRGRLITMNNLLRVSLTHGAANVVLMKDEQILKHLSDTGIARGRPRER